MKSNTWGNPVSADTERKALKASEKQFGSTNGGGKTGSTHTKERI